MVAFGYIAGNSRQFGFWKFVLVAFLASVFLTTFDDSGVLLATVIISFVLGYILPYARYFEGFGDSLSDFINSIRYRDAYADIKRKEEEVENLRRMYERERASRNNQQEEKRQERKRQSEGFRRQNQSSSDSSSSSSGKSQQSSRGRSIREKYLETLGLGPEGEYSFQDIKTGYRRMANKWHPDKFSGQSEAVIREASERFKEIIEAFEWLAKGSK